MSKLSPDESRLYLIVGVVCLPFSVMLYAWAVALNWEWFVMPYFNLPPLQWQTAYGLVLLSRLLTVTDMGVKQERNFAESLGAMFTYAILYPVFVMVFGFIVQAF